MKLKIFIISIFAFCLLQPQIIEAQKKRPVKKVTNITLTARQIADKVLPSVVLIITQDENENPISQGSGFVIGQGLVVSNLHVFERATNAIVKNVKTGETSKAIEVVGMNAKEDICVFRIDNAKFPVLSLGNSDSIQTGDEIYVASNPKGLEGSFTKGIISGVRKDVGLFQIDAAISSGSSGGVLVNQKAEAIGIIKSSLVSGQNLNFAIPINKLKVIPHKFKHSIQLAGACAYKDRDKERLKGLVKSVTEKELPKQANTGRTIGTEPIITSIIMYDLDGNEIERKIFQPTDGKLAIKTTFKYDENRIKKSVFQEFLGGSVKEINFDFNDGIYNKLYGRKFSGNVGELDGQVGMQVYDSDGNMITWFLRGVKIVYKYDSSNSLIESTQWNGNKIEIITRYSYKNDSQGNWIEKYEIKNYPNTQNINPNKWYEDETTFREITYYE